MSFFTPPRINKVKLCTEAIYYDDTNILGRSKEKEKKNADF